MLRVKLGDLKTVVREEYLRGLPDFVLRNATQKYVDEVRRHLKLYITTNVKNPADQREAYAIANATLEELEEEANDLLSNKLFQFTRRV